MPVLNPLVLAADSAIEYFTTGNQGTDDVIFEFASDSITGTGGTLTFGRDASNVNTINSFYPTFSGAGFDFGRPVVISNDPTDSVATPRKTVLTSANTEGTQTWSGVISGNGSYSRNGAGGTSVFTADNTYSGGTDVAAGTLVVDTLDGSLGTGDVTVTGGLLSILTGVDDAIADSAMLSIDGTGIVNLGSGIDETIAALSLGGELKASGTYGSSSSPATFQFDQYFTGSGMVRIEVAGLAGDYNDDGKVDAADYVIWRKRPADFGGDPDGYDTWRNNFGNPSGAGGAVSLAAVPEPAALALLLFALGAVVAGRSLPRTR
jgi:autotransporter-associated beta strand protein